jgi:gamma-glutamyltranspeptidase/glutathione hydrolase
MTPTIIEKNGGLFMVLGTPGGSTIITSVFQVLTNVIDFKMNIRDAVTEERFHHQWKPDLIYHENSFDSATVLVLQSLGHKLTSRDPIGRVEAILVKNDGTLSLAADPRGDDDAKGL